MGIAVICASCGSRLRFKNDHAGKTTICRSCGKPLVVSGDPTPDRDVFISYSTKDQHIADAVCAALEAREIRCWIAPRDIVAGKAWAAAILDGLDDCRTMVLVFSENSNQSAQVLREVDRAVNRALPIVPFRIEHAPMSKEMEYYIGASHWLDAMDGEQEKNIATLAATVGRLLGQAPPPFERTVQASTTAPEPVAPQKSSLAAVLYSSVVAVVTLSLVFAGIHHFKPQLIPDMTKYVTSRMNGNGSETSSAMTGGAAAASPPGAALPGPRVTPAAHGTPGSRMPLPLPATPSTSAQPPAAAAIPPAALPHPAGEAAWVSLFNGKDLTGWIVDGDDPKTWGVEDGVIVTHGVDARSRNFLLTERDYSNFILRLEFMIDPDTISSIALRALPQEWMPGKIGGHILDHPHLKLRPASDGPEPMGTAHWMSDRWAVLPDVAAAPRPAPAWNQLEIELDGHTLRASLNGTVMITSTFSTAVIMINGSLPGLNRAQGRVGLQRRNGTIRFRNIQIKELPRTK